MDFIFGLIGYFFALLLAILYVVFFDVCKISDTISLWSFILWALVWVGAFVAYIFFGYTNVEFIASFLMCSTLIALIMIDIMVIK